MESKKDMETKAKALIESSPDDAVKAYHSIYEVYPDQFNSWDTFFTIKAMRASKLSNLVWAHEIAEKYKSDRVGNMYGWLIFDKCVKGKNRNELIANEIYINDLPQLSPQKNCRGEDSFPCPTTISTLSISKVYAKPSFNAIKIESFLSPLNIDFLSLKPGEPKDKVENEDEFASDFEKYCSLRSKALLKVGKFQECKDLCEVGLKSLEKFHYNNDTWFKMRIALAEDGIGNHETSEQLFKALLESKAGNDKWFLYRDIAEVYFEQNDFTKAWKYSVDAAFYGNEPHFLINLYLLQARLLFKLNRPTEGKLLAELVAAILIEQKWPEKSEHLKLFDYYKIDKTKLSSVNEIIKQARIFWQHERYGNKQKHKGSIISIHKNGKIGRIKLLNGNIIGFHKKDLVKKMKSIESLNGATIDCFIMESYDGKKIAENITVESQLDKPKAKPNDLVGKTLNGTVKNVAEFGVFFLLEGAPNGLLHKNSLPTNLKDNFKDQFPQGKKLQVVVEKVTDKGIQLKLVDNV